MLEANFWDNPEKAQGVIAQIKPLNGVIKPFEELESAAGDVQAMAELAEEDSAAETDLEQELAAFEKRLADFEMRSMLSGPQDASNAYLRIQAGADLDSPPARARPKSICKQSRSASAGKRRRNSSQSTDSPCSCRRRNSL